MSYITHYVLDKVTAYFRTKAAPAYAQIREQNGFRYDSLARRGGPDTKPDVSILCRVGTAYLWHGVVCEQEEWISEAGAALRDVLSLQQPDGRWERGVKDAGPSLDEAFDTADAVQFAMHGVRAQRMDPRLLRDAQGAAIRGARWLTEGEVAPAPRVAPGPPLKGLMSFENANYTGSVIRALAMVGGKWLEQAVEGAQALVAWQLPCGSWRWYRGADKVSAGYHDLTMAGLCETFAVSQDRRFRSAIETGIAFLEQLQGSNGLMAEQWTPDGPSRQVHYSGLMSACMAYGCTLERSDASVRELATGLTWALTRVKFPRSASPYAVEKRLVIIRGLTEFVRVFGQRA